MKVWPSYYDGLCSNCGRRFVAGTAVKYEGGRIVEDVCASSDPEDVGMGPKELKVYREQMCVKCFTVHGAGQEECS